MDIHVRRNPSTHSQRLERWIGAERLKQMSESTRGWYGRPIPLLDVPGGVRVCGDGDFIGPFERGFAVGAVESLWERYKLAARAPHGRVNAGFSSISDALSRASQGFQQRRTFNKIGPSGATGGSQSLWRYGPQPAVGATPGNAPGGTVYDNTATGALTFANPSVGTNRLTGADITASVASNCLLLYDLLFGVNKTMNSTATEAVTGVPNRYTSTTPANEDYAGDNFLSIWVGATNLAATAHNWTVCQYTDDAGNTAQTLPSVTGVSGQTVDRIDSSSNLWFHPLATGDVGVKALSQMQCSALVATGAIWFFIGHPIGMMTMPLANMVTPFDWLTNRNQAPRIFDNACLAFIEPPKPSGTATIYTGSIYTTSTSA